MPIGEESGVGNIFRLMEVMCQELRDLSYTLNNKSVPKTAKLPNNHRPLYQNFVFSRMLWSKLVQYRLSIAIYLKVPVQGSANYS